LLWAILLLGIVGLATFLRKGYFAGHPFWLDEAWVVDTTRAAPGRVFEMSATGPPLWTSLLRLVPNIGGPERYRVVPFLWSIACVAPAAAIGAIVADRPKSRLWYALGAALAVAILPQMILRQDLKQYTAEAFFALGLLFLAARLEQHWSPRRLAGFAVVAAPAVLIASTAAFVNVAAFLGLFLALALDRRWRRCIATAATGAVVMLSNVILLVTVSLTTGEKLRDYWKADFIPLNGGVSRAFRFVAARVGRETAFTHLPTLLIVALAAVAVAVLWTRGLRMFAVAGPALLAGMLIAGSAKIYPFMERRTSLFFVVVIAVYVGVAMVWLAGVLARNRVGIALVVAGLIGLAFPLQAADRVAMRPSIPLENVRDQVTYIEGHRQPGDVIVVGYPASFGFAYYWPSEPTFVPKTRTEPLITFAVTYPHDRTIVVASYIRRSDIEAAMRDGLSRARVGARVWVVLSHDNPAAWEASAPPGTRVRRVMLALGPTDALLVLTATRP
jgi:hypothetical protein